MGQKPAFASGAGNHGDSVSEILGGGESSLNAGDSVLIGLFGFGIVPLGKIAVMEENRTGFPVVFLLSFLC